MDFAFTPEEEAFAAKVRRFLAENPPESFAVDGMDAGYGSGSHSRPFLRALAERGWLALTWPKAHGGYHTVDLRARAASGCTQGGTAASETTPASAPAIVPIARAAPVPRSTA